MSTVEKTWTATDVAALIRQKYSGQKWAVFFDVPNATGLDATRRADALAMGMWPSAGLHLHGFEIKVSRGDWLREIQNPLKAHAIAKYCHFWWVVAPAGVVKVEEMPPSWGLQVASENGLRVKKGVEPGQVEPISLGFLAAILRKAQQSDPDQKAFDAAYRRGVEDGRKREREIKKLDPQNYELERLKQSIADFEETSGIKIQSYNGGALGDAVKAMQNSGVKRLPPRLRHVAQQMEDFIKDCRVAADILAECFEDSE